MAGMAAMTGYPIIVLGMVVADGAIWVRSKGVI